MIRTIELFAGIGAQRQALKEAGIEHRAVAISEVDKYACMAYEALHGRTENVGDIRKVDRLPEADLWTYSFPCTDISLSGRMKGFNRGSGTQSSLIWEVQRLLQGAKDDGTLPRFLLMENVKNIVSKRFYPLFKEWLDFLASLGYRTDWKILNAKDYGIPQNRERCFAVSVLGGGDQFPFPDKIPLTSRLSDYLEKKVPSKYFMSDRLITYMTSMKSRNGYVRGLKFRPVGYDSEWAWTITTSTGSRPTDNFILVPVEELEKRCSDCVQINSDAEGIVVLPQATKAGYAVAQEGDGIYINRVQWKRGVVQKGMIPTLKTSGTDVGVVTRDENSLVTIRRLSPRECWRLMGWKDVDIDKVIGFGVSDTQMYKLAGNSIVINCLQRIFAFLG